MIDGEEVVHELVLPAPPEQVFDMFIDPNLLVRWIGISAVLDPQEDGVFSFEVVPGQLCKGRYVVVERPNHLVFTWGWTDPTFDLPPGSSEVEVLLRSIEQGSATSLRLVHRGLSADGRLLHDDGWTTFLARLRAVMSGEPPPSYPSADPKDRLDELRGPE